MKKLKTVFIVVGIILLGLLGVRLYYTSGFHIEKEARFMMGTYITVYAVGPQDITSKAIDSVFSRMQEIDVKFNLLNPSSPIYSFNEKNEPISDPEILGLVRVAQDISKNSGGAFDITVGPLVELWGFGSKSYYLPREEEIKGVLNNVGYWHLLLDNKKLSKDNSGIKIDLGGIAKGYALSEAAKILRAQGVKSALIDVGGDIYAMGKKGRTPWRIGIKNPRQEGILGYVEVEDLAVIGSGDYERSFVKDGKRYHHIFNPKTGYPTEEGVISVTLIYPDPILAQAWAKIPFVTGPKKGLALLEQIPGMEALIITASGDKLYSSGLKHTFKIIPDEKNI